MYGCKMFGFKVEMPFLLLAKEPCIYGEKVSMALWTSKHWHAQSQHIDQYTSGRAKVPAICLICNKRVSFKNNNKSLPNKRIDKL